MYIYRLVVSLLSTQYYAQYVRRQLSEDRNKHLVVVCNCEGLLETAYM